MTSPAPTSTPAPAPIPAAALAVIGIDPGARWTAAVLRVGDHPVHGWTLGPVNRLGELDVAALDNPDDWAAFGRYAGRVLDALGQLVTEAEQHHGAVRVAIEAMNVPVGWRSVGHGRYNRLPLADWLTPTRTVAAVIGAYPDARLVLPDKLGRRPADAYPHELRGPRPADWGPGEARRGERDHERAAYDVAGLAAAMP
ncbi:MAG: hypothetical protein ACRDUW_20235 [Pseudonocardiaceae bacterium]